MENHKNLPQKPSNFFFNLFLKLLVVGWSGGCSPVTTQPMFNNPAAELNRKDGLVLRMLGIWVIWVQLFAPPQTLCIILGKSLYKLHVLCLCSRWLTSQGIGKIKALKITGYLKTVVMGADIRT